MVSLKGQIDSADKKFHAIMDKKDEADAINGVENFDKLKLDQGCVWGIPNVINDTNARRK